MLESKIPLAIFESKILLDEKATEDMGAQLAKATFPPLVIYLQGELGMGKTTFVRGFLRSLGYAGIVKSPTFTLVEEYEFPQLSTFIYHFDLYRLNDPEALEFMGIREYLHRQAILLIEWPEQGGNYISDPDIIIQIKAVDQGRCLKILFLTAQSLAIQESFK